MSTRTTGRVWGVVAAFALHGCAAPYGGITGELGETGWFDETPPTCSAAVESVEPAEGTTAHVWSEPIRAFVSEASDVYAFRLTDAGGAEIPVEVEVEPSGLVHQVRPVGGLLPPDAALVLQVTDCQGTSEVAFHTSTLGLPLEGGIASVRGRTYVLDLDDAEWLEPAGASGLLSSVLAPILLGVRYVDERSLAWLGGLGRTELGGVEQDEGAPTWNYPLAAFDRAPWLEAVADDVVVELGAGSLRILDFAVRGTFRADGRAIEEATVTGVGDTRDAGGAVGSSDPSAICDLAEAISAPCQPCADGQVYCLAVHVRHVAAPVVDDLVLRPILPD